LAQQTPPPAQLTATIIGTVRDITGSTVPNASVVLQGPTEHHTLIVMQNERF
jgi:hypothetical protein